MFSVMFGQLSWMFLLIFGFILIGICLPFVASLVLDGAASMVRTRKASQLMVAIVATGIVAAAGYWVWKSGVAQDLQHDSLGTFAQTMRDTIAAFLPYSIGFAILGAIVRVVRSK